MANRQSLWQRFLGGAVNAALPGKPYSRYSGYDPTLVRNSLISGVAGQLIPGGGTIAQQFLNRTDSAQAALAGQEGLAGLMRQTDQGYRNWDQEFRQDQYHDDSGIGPVQREPIAIGGFQGPNPGFAGGYNPAPMAPSYQPNYSSAPTNSPSGQWNSGDIGLSGGVFQGGAGNFGENGQAQSTARGFSGVGPIVPGYLSFGGDAGVGNGGVNPFMRQSKLQR